MKKTYEVQYRLRKGGRWYPSHGRNFRKPPSAREIQEELSTMVEDLTYYSGTQLRRPRGVSFRVVEKVTETRERVLRNLQNPLQER